MRDRHPCIVWEVHVPDQGHPIMRARVYRIVAFTEQAAKDAVLLCLNNGIYLTHTWAEVDAERWPEWSKERTDGPQFVVVWPECRDILRRVEESDISRVVRAS